MYFPSFFLGEARTLESYSLICVFNPSQYGKRKPLLSTFIAIRYRIYQNIQLVTIDLILCIMVFKLLQHLTVTYLIQLCIIGYVVFKKFRKRDKNCKHKELCLQNFHGNGIFFANKQAIYLALQLLHHDPTNNKKANIVQLMKT